MFWPVPDRIRRWSPNRSAGSAARSRPRTPPFEMSEPTTMLLEPWWLFAIAPPMLAQVYVG